MSEHSPSPGSNGVGNTVRPLAVRLADDLRAQLDVIAALNERSLTEEIRVALEEWVSRARSDPSLQARAVTVRAEIDREAAARRSAIESMFADGRSAGAKAPKRAEAS